MVTINSGMLYDATHKGLVRVRGEMNDGSHRGIDMKLKGLWQRALIGLLVFLMAIPAPVFAQNQIPVFRQEELDQMLAPIALYPDSLLAQILMASTYPIEVVQADRWVKANRNLPAAALNDGLDRQSWDPSVKALVPFPNVLSMMSERLDWTQSVGDAFLAQEADVMDSVQRLRARAYAAGNLNSNQQQRVSREGAIIVIEPASPQVVYVPAYNPVVIYGRWWYPAYPPVVIYPYPPGAVIAAGVIFFGVGIAVASAWNHGWGRWDWGHRNVYVNVNRTVNINRTTTVINTRDIRTTTWQHSPEHRKGVAYRDPGTRERYAPTNRQAVDSRRDYRGRDQTGPAGAGSAAARPAPATRPGQTVARPAPETKPAPAVTRPAPETKPGPATVARPAPQTRPEAGVTRPAPDTRTGPATAARPAPQAKPAPAVSRPAPQNTIYGVDQGGKVRKESARGRESLSSSKGRESSQPSREAKPSREAPQAAPDKQQAPAQGGAQHGGGGPAHR
jgi:hypothetical protein